MSDRRTTLVRYCTHCGAFMGSEPAPDCEVRPDLSKPYETATCVWEEGPDKGRKTVFPVACLTKVETQ